MYKISFGNKVPNSESDQYLTVFSTSTKYVKMHKSKK